MMIYLRLIYEFFKTGLLAVGGGLATLPFLYEISNKTHWFTHGDIMNMIAVSESTPGAIGINMSTYVGNMTAGVLGGIIATLSLAAPSIIIITLISRALQKFRDAPVVEAVFKVLRPASTALITAALLGVARNTLLHPESLDAMQAGTEAITAGSILGAVNWFALIMAAIFFVAMHFGKKKIHPIVYIAISAVLGVAFSL